MPQTESFYLYVVVDGSLRLFTPSGILDYVPGQYSVSKIDTPNAGHVQAFSQEGDFLALAIEFTPNDVISVVLDLEGGLAQEIADGTVDSGVMERADRAVLSSICRLLSAAREPPQLSFMGKQILREILFYVLCGASGSRFLRSVVNFQQAGEIYAANSWIKENFRSSFTVEELAERRNMSVSQFHQKFKNAVGMGPLQCQKRLRLTEGRRLMLDEGKNATEAALDVGYESPLPVHPGLPENVQPLSQRGDPVTAGPAGEIGNFFRETGKRLCQPLCYNGSTPAGAGGTDRSEYGGS